MFWLRRAVATAWVLCLALIAWDLRPHAAQADLERPAPSPPAPWRAPDWHPYPEGLAALPDMEGHAQRSSPRLRARAAFVYDLDADEIIVDRASDDRRPVASLTKLVSSLALASEDADLDAVHCVDKRFWPNRSGARSKLSTGECYTGWDLLGAALVSSDNRGAFGLQVTSGLPYGAFVERMDAVSEDLVMTQSSWADPSGLEDDNLSTARDMARAAVAVAAHPTLSIAASAPFWRIGRVLDAETRSLRTPATRTLFSTDRLVGRSDMQVLAGKTGYTDTAGYCFAGVVQSPGGRTLALAVLGAGRSAWRWQDVSKLIRFADDS
ncbi:MAG: D-alanyl-D-alanine carboxypeptidase [Alphaproteobacteria bacterium]|nr:D-alanyl-D-alanine carboxypeptidase [Alphaproteobacteria bacterium]